MEDRWGHYYRRQRWQAQKHRLVFGIAMIAILAAAAIAAMVHQ